MLYRVDVFDPNSWGSSSTHEFRIYGDDSAQTWALVDEDDYHHFVRWRWNPKPNKNGALYLRRAAGGSRRKGDPRDPVYTVYLHVEIMIRTGISQPSAKHALVDHKNGNSLDCRRENLRWATPRENRLNVYGNQFRYTPLGNWA